MLIAGRYESSRFKRSSFIIRRVASIQRIHVQLPSLRISAMLSVYHIPFASLRDYQLASVTIVAKHRGTVSTIFTVQRFLLVARVPFAGKKNKCLWTVEKTGSLRWRGIRTTRCWLLWVSGENRKEKRKLLISSIDDPIFLICHPVSSWDTCIFWLVVNRILFLIRAEVGKRHESDLWRIKKVPFRLKQGRDWTSNRTFDDCC